MRTARLDETLDALPEVVASRGNRWTEMLAHAREWIRAWDSSSGGMPAMVKSAIQGQRAFIPTNMLVDAVGIPINGSFSPLGMNPNMLDMTDCCGEFEAPDTGHPDLQPTRYEGNVTEWDASDHLFWPGLGGGQSVYGYYRMNTEKNYVIFDKLAAPTDFILLRGTVPTFTPRMVTRINELAVPAIRAYCQWKGGDRSMRTWNAHEMGKLRSALNREPLCVMVAAWMRGYGRMGI